MEKEELLKKYKILKDTTDIQKKAELFSIILLIGEEKFLDEFIKTSKDLYNQDPILYIGNHVQFYMIKEDIQKALEVLEFYQNEPFISLKVEDFMKELKEEILKFTKNLNKHQREINFKEDLLSSNMDRKSRAFEALSNSNIRNHLNLIQEVLLTDLEYKQKVMLLLIMVDQKVNKDFLVKNKSKTFHFNPLEMKLPLMDENYKKCLQYLDYINESISVISQAKQILDIYEICNYPESIFSLGIDPLQIGEIVLYMSKSLFNDNPDFNVLLKNTTLSKPQLEDLIKKIQSVIY